MGGVTDDEYARLGCSSLKMNECNLIATIKTRRFDNSVSANETSKFAFIKRVDKRFKR